MDRQLFERIRSGVPAEITFEDLGSALEPEVIPAPARAYDRRRDGLTARRRRGDAHRIIASMLAVLALVGCVTAILVLAIEPTAARLEGDIGSLNTRLSDTQSQLNALQKVTIHQARQGSRLTRRVGLLDWHMRGLGRTVHGLQGSATATREQADGLRACFAALQRELSGLTLKTRSVHGHVTNVGLADTIGQSAACGAAFG
jgi:hypothetical protein